MHILLTNDDGIHALGLCALYEALAPEHQVTVVAPDRERSAVGHAITLSDPIKARKSRFSQDWGWAIDGTPADCVKLAVNRLADKPVDLVVSGINIGANVGINVLYSGTVSAATEAAILGIKSMAISIDTLSDPQFCTAAFYAKKMVNWLAKRRDKLSVNVNVPPVGLNRIKGIKVTKQATFNFKERFEERIDPRGNIYFWQCLANIDEIPDTDCDIYWLKRDYITITPIGYDLTNYQQMTSLTPPEI